MRSISPTPALARALFLVPALAGILTGCGGPAEPVAELALEPSASLRLPSPGRDRLEVEWTLLEPIDGSPYVFVHLIDGPGNVLHTWDHPFSEPWSPGETVASGIDVWQSALAPPLPPGTYDLTVGLYDPSSGRRWPLEVDGEEIDRAEYAVAQVTVPPPTADPPELAFSDSWLPEEPTGDRQLFAVRWLEAGSGWIALSGLEGPTTLVLSFRIPRLEEQGFRLLTDETDEEQGAAPRVSVTSGCSSEVHTLEGHGHHEVELELTPSEPGGRCSVDLEPEFVFLEETTLARRTLLLEKLLWDANRPAPAE